MKVTIDRGGTIVPVVVTTEADTDELDPEAADQLRRLVAAAVPLGGSAAAGGEPGPAPSAVQPDRGGYRVTIADGDASHSAVLRDQDVSPALRELIDFVAAMPRGTAAPRPPGANRTG